MAQAKKYEGYGRRLLKWRLSDGKIVYTLSGQWVGHSGYGDQWGTERQRQNAAPTKTAKLMGISKKILWRTTGYAGEKISEKVGSSHDFVKP